MTMPTDTPENSAPPAAAPAVDTGSPTESHWYAGLPEDLVGDANITKYQSMEELARGHISAVSMIGRDKIALPVSDSEFRDVYAKLGMPENHEGYEIEEKDYGIPENVYSKQLRETDLVAFKQMAHEAGLSKKQGQLLYDKFMTHQSTTLKAFDTVVQSEMAKVDSLMAEKWGEARAVNLEIANRALTKYFGADVTRAVEASGLGRNFDFINGMYKLGAGSLEELGLDKHGTTVQTPDQLYDELSKLQNHVAYFDSKHPEHQMVNARALSLFERIDAQNKKSGL